MPSKRRNISSIEKTRFSSTNACIFCGLSEESEKFGDLFNKDSIRAHNHCLYFASNLIQRGKVKDGIIGFLIEDIVKEKQRGRRLTCTFCRRQGATIGCSVSRCQVKYHFDCGLEQKALYQYFGHFRSYCAKHAIKQPSIKVEDLICPICYSEVSVDDALYCPKCACKYFHRECIQAYALNSGEYFFKCPLCQNNDCFPHQMKKYGINVPLRDASWERETNAYQELLARPGCSSQPCLCPSGRDYSGAKTRFLKCSYLAALQTSGQSLTGKGMEEEWPQSKSTA